MSCRIIFLDVLMLCNEPHWDLSLFVCRPNVPWCTCRLVLKLPSLFAAWYFWTYLTKSQNMKHLVILSHSWSPFSHLPVCMKKWTFVGTCKLFWGIFLGWEYFTELFLFNIMKYVKMILDKLVYKAWVCVIFGIIWGKEKEALKQLYVLMSLK